MNAPRPLAFALALALLAAATPQAAAGAVLPSFLLEGELGAATWGHGGPAAGLVFGMGGGVPGAGARAYLLGEVGWQYSGTSGHNAELGMDCRDDRSALDLLLGMRLAIPLHQRLRLLAEGQVGGSLVTARLQRQGLPPREGSGWLRSAQLGAGLQLRLRRHRHLWFGLRFKVQPSSDDLAGLRGQVGASSPIRSQLTAGLTWEP